MKEIILQVIRFFITLVFIFIALILKSTRISYNMILFQSQQFRFPCLFIELEFNNFIFTTYFGKKYN